MIVNINQCASMYEETLNVLKFSAVAQKVPDPFVSLSSLADKRWVKIPDPDGFQAPCVHFIGIFSVHI